jgi:hypothetical protein
MLDYSILNKMYLLMAIAATIVMAGCTRNTEIAEVSEIKLYIIFNGWAGGSSNLEQKEYLKEMETWKRQPLLFKIFTLPDSPDNLIDFKMEELRVAIKSGEKTVYEAPIEDHLSGKYALVNAKNEIVLLFRDQSSRVFEFSGRKNQTIQLTLGPGVTFYTW